jgi:alpha-galactosidase
MKIEKVTFIGAGSFRFSLGLFRNFVAAKELFPYEVCLHDIDATSLGIMTKILTKMVRKADANITVTSTTNRHDALENADFLYKSISVGIQKAEWFDIHLPMKFGIPQNTGDTCGPGGLFRSLRCVPVVRDIAQDMKDLCSKDAVLLNYTNPQATIVMGARRVNPDLQYVGLCHELFSGMDSVKKALELVGKPVGRWQDLDIRYGGVNHFAWLTSVEFKDGEDLYPLLRENVDKFIAAGDRVFNWYLMKKYGSFPYPGSRHVAEFMPEYYNYFNHAAHSKAPFKFPWLRDVYLLDKARKAAYWGFRRMAGPMGGLLVPKPTMHGEKAIDMTLDWLRNEPTHHVVNLPNRGYIPNLPEDAIVEIPGFFSDGKMVGVDVGPLPDEIADLVRPHAEQQFLTVDAALASDPQKIVDAMLHDPMNKLVDDDERIEDLTWNMLHYEQEWLPASWKEFIPSLDDLKKRKHFVEPKEIKRRSVARVVKYPVADAVKKKAIINPLGH